MFFIGEHDLQYTELGTMKDSEMNRNMTLLQEPSFASGSKPISDEHERIKIGDTRRFSKCAV